jgi:hypothetical protein
MIVALAGIWLAFTRNREMKKTIRFAIEKGMPLDAGLIDSLRKPKPSKPEDYWIGGVISIAVGIGLPILGYFIGKIDPVAFFPVAGAGILMVLIGIGLVLCGVLIDRREKAGKNGNRRA